jgi:hypothetical protein
VFDSNSRYANLNTMTLTDGDGSTIRYVARRFLPQGEAMASLQTISVIAGDRIDLVASRTLGDPEQFWRVCDANNAMYPLDLTMQPGRELNIPMPTSYSS